MVYFVRAKTHFKYAQDLWKEILTKKRSPNLKIFQDIFRQGLKALYSITVLIPQEHPPTLEELLEKVLPTLSEEEKEEILNLRDFIFPGEDYNFVEERLILEKIKRFLDIVYNNLKPIL